MGIPTIYPTGTTIYKPEKCFNGFTVFPAAGQGVMLIDMNGKEVKLWKDVHGFPPKILKGGNLMASRRVHHAIPNEYYDLSQIDWDGNVVWTFDHAFTVKDADGNEVPSGRYKSDFQREGNPVGYYVPGMECKTENGNTLMLIHREVKKRSISLHTLLDDVIIEVDWDGNIVWEWQCSDHYKEFGFSEQAKNVLARNPGLRPAGPEMVADWMHINNFNVLGPNKWYDAGDERFHPDNIIWDSRESNISAIISKETGKVVWKLGPDFDTPETKHIGWIIGQHHVHMIPKGLPGEGNILIYDNGGFAGYGDTNPTAPTGNSVARRDYSRILEIDPITFEIVWQYSPAEAGSPMPIAGHGFYSPFASSMQRLPNGNTMICEASGGRFMEVTRDHELVWEYISPYNIADADGNYFVEKEDTHKVGAGFNWVYRAYRVPYDYCPRGEHSPETPVNRVDITTFRVPGAADKGGAEVTTVAGTQAFDANSDDNKFCLQTDEQAAETMRKLEEG